MDNRTAALAEIDTVLAAKPNVDGHTLSLAAQHLSALRDDLAGRPRDPATRRSLGHVNAVISVVLAVHFPLGGIPWPELVKARAWLAELP